MAGFSGITGDETIMFTDNCSFDGTQRGGKMTTNGDLWIGATAAPHVRKGNLTSTGGTITITNGAGTINLDLAGGSEAIDSIGVQTGTNPIVPTAGGLVTINGATVTAGTNPVRTDGTGANTMAVEVQISQAIAATNATNIGLAAFDSAAFDVDANGFVQLNGGGIATTAFDVQANTAPGTDPVVPTAAGVVTVNGAAVANHSVVLETRSRAANAYNLEVQYSAAAAATDATKSGVAHFDSARFTVDASGFVSVNGSGLGETITGNSGGALSPTAGNWNILGASTAAGTSPVTTSGVASTLTVNVQKTQALAATDATKIGLANFNSAYFTADANGFVGGTQLTGSSGGALTPSAANFNILGASTAAGTTPVAVAGSGSTLTVNIQKSQAIAATDATKVGLCNFNSTQFSVDANGFVSTSGTGIANTITGDSGGALSPTAGNWNILGRSGSKTSGSGSTLTINSPAYADAGGSATSTLNSGSFVTGAFTLTLPASAGLADGDLFEYVATSASAMIIQAVSAQKIRIGSLISSAAGTATSTAIGDSLTLRFRAADGFFYATSVIGTWLIA